MISLINRRNGLRRNGDSFMYYIGVDLGGTNIAVGIVSEDGKIIAKKSVKTLAERHFEEIIQDMADCALSLLKDVYKRQFSSRSACAG